MLDDLGYRLYAENGCSLLLVLQGMDSAGKDGTIRHVMQGFNPQCCQVTAFKQPGVSELAHDFLWRIFIAVPRGASSASSTARTTKTCWWSASTTSCRKKNGRAATSRINQFEKLLPKAARRSSRCFCTSARTNSSRRLQSRVDDPTKRWKFSRADLQERRDWDEYQAAYEAAMTRCNTKHAPWYIVPANRKWYRNLVVSRILRKTLEKMSPRSSPAGLAEEGLEGLVGRIIRERLP